MTVKELIRQLLSVEDLNLPVYREEGEIHLEIDSFSVGIVEDIRDEEPRVVVIIS